MTCTNSPLCDFINSCLVGTEGHLERRHVCNGKEVPIVGGFRGFRNVPPGAHTIENHGAKLEVELEAGEVKVFVLDSSENVSAIYTDYCGIHLLM